METIKVNMTPCEDVKTIHASQNDNEAREWGFELHNNGEKIDSSSISDQMVFKAYEGGTEEIYPNALYNGSVDLGSLDWSYVSAYGGAFQSSGIVSVVADKNDPLCDIYTKFTPNSEGVANTNMGIAINANGNGGTIGGAYGYKNIVITNRSFTDPSAFKQAMQGVMLYFTKTDSTPTTSPFKGDIKYLQGLLSDQEFTYRQSPTEEDGLAKITDIKGNTLVWNQLLQNGNFEVTTGWATSGRGTLTVSNNVATITPNRSGLIVTGPVIRITVGHKYLLSVELKADSTSVWIGTQYNDVHVRLYSNGTNQWQRLTSIVSNFANDSQTASVFGDGRPSGWTASQIRNFMFIDLTQMGLDSITDPSDFTSLFSLPYYAYNQGTLLSFNGNGIKTVGKNLFNSTLGTTTVSGVSCTKNDDGSFTFNGVATTDGYFRLADNYQFNVPSSVYVSVVSSDNSLFANFGIDKYDSSIADSSSASLGTDLLVNHPSNIRRVWVHTRNGATFNNVKIYPMIRFATVSDDTYEPYTSFIADLPISQYFPNGMKSAGSVYDELTETKAITRIGSVDLGTLTWQISTNNRMLTTGLRTLIKIPSSTSVVFNGICPKYIADTNVNVYNNTNPNTMAVNANGDLLIYDVNFASYTADTFKSAMSSVYLYYELKTSTETSFSTASLVTENAEIPLSNEDGTLIGKCTEQLSAEPGFHDAKIKLADEDGECYSNKIQLHIERSPQ